jgi:hypothetical protein
MSVAIQTKTGRVGVTKTGSFVCSNPVSEIITSWVYLANKRVLAVTWGDKNYHYYEVPFSTVHAMMSAESLGKFLNAEVKPNYKNKKIDL